MLLLPTDILALLSAFVPRFSRLASTAFCHTVTADGDSKLFPRLVQEQPLHSTRFYGNDSLLVDENSRTAGWIDVAGIDDERVGKICLDLPCKRRLS